ncbi:MAG: glycoside hydrolase family 9 protein [Bacteroidales bacterium]
MLRSFICVLVCSLALQTVTAQETGAWIRINQLGYLPGDIKVAVMISKEEADPHGFRVLDVRTGDCVFSGVRNDGSLKKVPSQKWGMASAFRLYFTDLSQEGGYRIEMDIPGKGTVKSPDFRIGTEVYDRSADFLLNYMRQQRCGYNPFLDAQCHQNDGYIVLHPERSGEKIDVTGGWHDATDYLQYLTTSANATFQMMFAYSQAEDKTVFGDRYNDRGRPGANGIPDILDEIRWGLEWLLKMNPEDKVMFNQIADDRDHVGFRLPVGDKADYGWGPDGGRPVYFITGERQGLVEHINRTTGVASSAGKFASAFAMGAELFKDLDPGFAAKMKVKALPAYEFAEEKPGNTQTCCVVSPYFYEEDNYVDDIQLAAAVFHHLGEGEEWLEKADYWGQLEEVTPWMELGRARHYQFYPFVNLGHYYLAASDSPMAEKYAEFMRMGLEYIRQRTTDCAFMNGIPYMWCSNNLLAAAITQADLYYKITGDSTYREMEASLRDWLFGCNPWGTSMIVGYPKGADYPERPHSSYLVTIGKSTPGGLVDGPLLRERHTAHGEYLSMDDGKDPYAPFNNGVALYHDEIWDYATNEPTMDGTASLSYYLSQREIRGRKEAALLHAENNKHVPERDERGGIIRINPGSHNVYLIFTADERFEGGKTVLETLQKHGIKASFFLTGNCLRNPQWEDLVRDIIHQGHYVGPHGDRHLLYAPWDGDTETSLVSADSLRNDIATNMTELERAGVDLSDVRWFMPSYEHFNTETVRVAASMGMELLHLTPGIMTRADYTTPDMPSYKSSRDLLEQLYGFEKENGLQGAVLLVHPGTEPSRTDKLYDSLDGMIRRLERKGYVFERLP